MNFSTKTILFPYKPNKHLSTDLTITNITSQPLHYKFKVSTANKFIVKPSEGTLSPKSSDTIQIIIHKQIVPRCENQKLQILYGSKPEDFMFELGVQEAEKESKMNLTMMVDDKTVRVKNLQKDIQTYKLMPKSERQAEKKTGLGLKIVLVLLIGVLVGMFAPIKVFKKRIRT